jgi:cysteine desulfurase
MSRVIYMDYAATTPVDPRVAQKMSDCLLVEGNFGNPASRSHVYGWRAEESVEEARTQVARLINADPREIVWTSGATESDNLALKGAAEGASRRHIVTSSVEHKAVLDTCKYLESRGYEVTYLDPGANGIVDPGQVQQALRQNTLIVSIMHVNNETGMINDIAAIGALCRAAGVLMHTDAAQSAARVPIDVRSMSLDLVSLSAHKMYGPKGVGALFVRRDPPVRLTPQIHGGGHERGMRSGTLATHQIVGMGEASTIVERQMTAEGARIAALRDRLLGHLLQIPGARLHGARDQRVPGIVNVGFEGLEGETLLLALDDLAVSTGSACTTLSVEPSHVLRAMGVPEDLAHASIRFSLGRYSTEQDVDHAGRRVREVVNGLAGRRPAVGG